MIMYDQEPDIVRWGLQLFDGNPYSDSAYCGSLSPSIPEYYDGQYYKNNSYGLENCNAHNDELLVHSIQQELSQFSVAEVNCSSEGDDNLQASEFPQEWLCQSAGDYNCGHDEVNNMVHSSSCSSIEDGSYRGEEWAYSLDLTDEYSSDSEVGKRLNQMASVPHVPKINGEIPSIDEATLDHQRLLDRLQLYDLIEHKVQGDGNCQFRALSDQFYRTPEHHEFVRQQVVEQLKSCPEVYEGYVPMAYGDYIEKMSSSGQWGDHVTLQAAADSYGVKIFVITSFKDTCYIEIIPSVQRSKRVVCLSFWAEVHYNSIYPEGDVPEFETKKKKRWRLFGNKRCQTHGEPT